MNNNQIYIVIL